MTYLKLVLTALFWGGTFISGRMLAAGGVHPVSAAFLRFAIATSLLLALVWKSHGNLPMLPRKLWLPAVLLGLTGVFTYNILFFWGLQKIEAGRASIIIANNPVMIALGAALFFRHRLGPVKTAGVVLSVSGAVIAISGGNPLTLFTGGLSLGDLLIFGCVFSWVSFSLIGKTVLSHVTPLVSIAYAGLAGTLMLMVPALMSDLVADLPSFTLGDWANMAYLGVFGTVLGFVWYYQGIERIGPTRAALFINFVPIFAILMAGLLLGEAITWSLALGAAMVIAGVYITNNGFSLPWRRHGTKMPR